MSDVIHKTGSTEHIKTPLEEDGDTAIGAACTENLVTMGIRPIGNDWVCEGQRMKMGATLRRQMRRMNEGKMARRSSKNFT